MTLEELNINPELDLVLNRYIPVKPARVWRAWTRPEELMKWFCPRPWKVVECRIDLRPGGEFYTVMAGPDGVPMPAEAGCFLEVVHERLLRTTDALGPDYRPTGSGFMSAVVIMEPEGEGCRYIAVARHGNPETRKQHEEMGFHHGWGAALDQLIELAQSEP